MPRRVPVVLGFEGSLPRFEKRTIRQKERNVFGKVLSVFEMRHYEQDFATGALGKGGGQNRCSAGRYPPDPGAAGGNGHR